MSKAVVLNFYCSSHPSGSRTIFS